MSRFYESTGACIRYVCKTRGGELNNKIIKNPNKCLISTKIFMHFKNIKYFASDLCTFFMNKTVKNLKIFENKFDDKNLRSGCHWEQKRNGRIVVRFSFTLTFPCCCCCYYYYTQCMWMNGCFEGVAWSCCEFQWTGRFPV